MPIDCKIANTFDTFPFAMPRQGQEKGNWERSARRAIGMEMKMVSGMGMRTVISLSVCVRVCGQCQFAIGRWHWANLCLVCLQANAK